MKWAIPKSFHDNPDLLNKARLIIKYVTVTFFLVVGFFPLQYFIFEQHVVGLTTLSFTILIGLTPPLMFITRSTQIAGNFYISSVVILISIVSVLYGGFVAPPIPFLLAGPMAAAFILGARGGVIWAIIVCVIVAGGSISEALGVSYPNENSPGQELFLRSVGIIAIVFVAMTFVVQFDALTRQALAQVQAGHHRMAQMIEYVEGTSTALSRSAAEFLGAETEHGAMRAVKEGLTHQMMHTASNGRDVIHEVGDSLLGMIAQYREISQRIQELHQQSGRIAELVKTIEKVSDRLDLMALNTGIEAIHAGESGKRFRTLSDDMRRLAERVSAETTRIKAVLKQIKSHTDVALEASIRGQELTDDGTSKLEGMSIAFDEMYRLIERTAEASKRMTEDTRNQIAAIRRLAQARQAIS